MNARFSGSLPWAQSARRERPAEGAFVWLVVADPSGDFLGRRFRHRDLSGEWMQGLVFWNCRSGEVRLGERVLRPRGKGKA